jgi:hypothetical protein
MNPVATVLVAALLLAGGPPPTPPMHFPSDKRRATETRAIAPASDASLVARVGSAVLRRVKLRRVETVVGIPATLNTAKNGHWELLRRVCIGPDAAKRGSSLDWKTARDVVYWVRPVRSRNPRIVGIVWTRDSGSKRFFGIIYPP